jgi:hypothetical protein
MCMSLPRRAVLATVNFVTTMSFSNRYYYRDNYRNKLNDKFAKLALLLDRGNLLVYLRQMWFH